MGLTVRSFKYKNNAILLFIITKKQTNKQTNKQKNTENMNPNVSKSYNGKTMLLTKCAIRSSKT